MKSTITTTIFGAPITTKVGAKPFLKWPGGKTRLLKQLQLRMPEHIGTYVEPFVGGGALFFNTQPAKAILNDSNPKLINLYVSVRSHKEELIDTLTCYEREYNTLTTLNASSLHSLK